MTEPALHLSPSELHRYVMGRTTQSLGYSGGDVKAWQRKLRGKLRELVGLEVRPGGKKWVRRNRTGSLRARGRAGSLRR